MILFKSVTYKNFLASGAMPITIFLDKSPSTLVIGKNGAGKSSFMDAITFALFGKPLRNINKPQLVNSKNNKELLVELAFNVDSTEYVIRRGIKPAIFEIYENGSMINQSAAVMDYQEYLEKMILKMNMHTFTQTVILSKATFIPFMKLNLAQRRLFIENILGLEIFALMNETFKSEFVALKESTSAIKTEIEILKNKTDTQKQYLDKLKSIVKRVNEDNNVKRLQSINDASIELHQVNELIDSIESELSGIEDGNLYFDDLGDKIRTFEEIGHKASVRISDAEKMYTFFTESDSCPTCSQIIDKDLKEIKIADIATKREKYDSVITECAAKVDILKIHLQKLDVNVKRVKELKIERQSMLSKRSHIENSINSITSTPVEIHDSNDSNEITIETEKLVELINEIQLKMAARNELLKEIEYANTMSTILKDGGIKAYVIKSYIGTINSLISNNLTKLNFLVKFELDEEFKETILSRRIDTFSYFNFSEGEKLRIDLAIIIAWRELLKMRGSINTNLLIFDEILDGSIDAAGRDAMVDILNELTYTNLFVISHSDGVWNDKFRGRLEFVNEQGFSKIKSKNV